MKAAVLGCGVKLGTTTLSLLGFGSKRRSAFVSIENNGAEGGIRTHTGLLPADLKSVICPRTWGCDSQVQQDMRGHT